MKPRELKADVVIIGAGTGGVAAALAAARNGSSVILTEETDWIGGQLTQQAVPPDEHPWIEEFGRTRSYRKFRDSVRAYYAKHYPLTPGARANIHLNPGNGWGSRLCFEPRVGVAVLNSMLAPYVASRGINLLLRHKPVSASVGCDYVHSVRIRDLEDGHEIELRAPYFIDATELGDLPPMTGAEYVTGAESRKETGEPHAPDKADPSNMQAITWCFAMEYCPFEDHTIEKPADYDFWRGYMPKLDPAWPGPILNWDYTHPLSMHPARSMFDPEDDDEAIINLWSYRRILDARNFAPGFLKGDVTIVNWPHNDYLPGSIIDVSAAEKEKHLRGAQQLSLFLFYWLQTAAPRLRGGEGWPELRPRGDITGASSALAKHPHIREARRIRAEFTIKEQHISTEERKKTTGLDDETARAEHFHDSIGTGCHRIDLHPTTGGDNYLNIGSLPFEIPLGALIHRRMENLLPAAKNIETTHISNGCYRQHPVEWNIGEAVGALVAYCCQKRLKPREVRNGGGQLAEFQAVLEKDGVVQRWPRPRPV